MTQPTGKMHWKNEYKINIPTIDAQHKQLFNTYTDLNQALKEGLKPSVIDETLTRMQQYVSRHFIMEEKFMRESSYPRIDEQIEAHRYFSNRFSEILEAFKEKGLTPDIVKSIQNELGQWLQTHVKNLDMDFGRHYNNQK